jgi:spermidine synthase/tetratricopeptide (TPR) repeat protein
MEQTGAKRKEAGSRSLVIPGLIVFVTSFCIMLLELVAGRIIARFLGSSLYTWTSVIGVVLAGIALGNYAGGRLADRLPGRKILAGLFALASVTCVVTIVLNNLAGAWVWLLQFSWPLHVFFHVSLVFLLPSTLLGTISPVVAKLALDRGLPCGRTVGDIYAWGAAGSIAGTFAAGYYLIGTLGSTAIIWSIAGVLLGMALLCHVRLRLLYLWTAVFVCACAMGLGPWDWTRQAGAALALRATPQANVIYEDETRYCQVRVKQLSSSPDHRVFMQDKLKHSEIVMGDLQHPQYFYQHVFAAVTHGLSDQNTALNCLVLGGGGYVFPRYVKALWPQSRVDVVEIDPGVTEAAIQAFGLARDTAITTHTMDARTYVDSLLRSRSRSGASGSYDFIYGDAVNDYSVPFQLSTRQFNQRISQLLTDQGVYMINLIDIFDQGRFLGAVVNTLGSVFPHVYVVARGDIARSARSTFVVIGAKEALDVQALCAGYEQSPQALWFLSESDLHALGQRSQGLVLTDDYAPVENLVSPVARADTRDMQAREYLKQAQQLRAQGRLDDCVRRLRDIIEIHPASSLRVYNEMGLVFIEQEKWPQAVQTFQDCLDFIKREGLLVNTGPVHWNLANALRSAAKPAQAREQLLLAVAAYGQALKDNPRSSENHRLLARTLATLGRLDEAGKHLLQAVNLNPLDVGTHLKLARNLERQGTLDKAVEHLEAVIVFMTETGRQADAAQLEEALQSLRGRMAPEE